MVHHKQTKRQRDIKTKLMAAICMLLVSSIMMVSTTYAWFTLSTAPEVTGITTAVGANGNLEMALMPEDGLTVGVTQNFGITSSAGDSTKAVNERNLTWGNLVDLSDSTFYGMDEITLYPAALNVATWDDATAKLNPATIASTMLSTPAYGADGRVSELLKNTTTSTYDSDTKSFPQNEKNGVRAVGTASGMTDRQLAYRNARSAANTAMAQAKTLASQSLNTNGSALANIAIAHGVKADATHTEADVNALKAIVNDLLGNGTNTGVLQHIENAYKNYIIAYGASQISVAAGMTDDQFKTFQSAVEGAATLADAITAVGTSVALPDSITVPAGKLAATIANVKSAQADLNAIPAGDGIVWNTISVPLNKLAKTDAMMLNGSSVNNVRDNLSAIIDSVLTKGLNVTIASEGGVYADIADHCGDFTASITIAKVEYNGLVLNNMTARMSTVTSVNPVYLSVLSTAVEGAGAPTNGEGGQTMPISDMYGYIVDLAFRTNAADSDLLLEVDGADRIYSDNGADAETMGHGSSMTFTSTTTDFTLAQMKGLMGAIRIVFFDPTNNSVLATAKLDMTNTVDVGGNTVTAKLYLYTNTAATVKYTAATAENITAGQAGTLTLYTKTTTDGVDSYAAVTDTTTIVADGEYYVAETVPAGETKLTDNVIAPLTQNTAKAVSVLVYLDGENVGNDDVAATASTSMTGSMNLQFASSANLVPMEYTPLMTQGGTATEATTEATTATTETTAP